MLNNEKVMKDILLCKNEEDLYQILCIEHGRY